GAAPNGKANLKRTGPRPAPGPGQPPRRGPAAPGRLTPPGHSPRAGTRGAGDLAGRPGPTGRSEKELDPARPRALADLPAGASRHDRNGAAEGEWPRRGPAAPAT